MDIDISVLRLMEREKDLPFEVLASAIEDALLTAYEKTEGAVQGARVELNRKTGHVTVMAPEYDENGQQIGEYDNTPAGFGRVAASTARQVIMQRLRDAEDEQKYGHFSGVEGDIVSGVVQQGSDSRTVLVDLGKIEAIMPLSRAGAWRALHPRNSDPGLCRLGSQGNARPADHRLPDSPRTGGEAVQARGARDRRRDGRDQGRGP